MVIWMLDSMEIRNLYNTLYSEMRKYIWDFDTVKCLADLEISCYDALQDIQAVCSNLNKLSLMVHDIRRDDELLDSAFSDFEELLDYSDDVFLKIFQVSEV